MLIRLASWNKFLRYNSRHDRDGISLIGSVLSRLQTSKFSRTSQFLLVCTRNFDKFFYDKCTQWCSPEMLTRGALHQGWNFGFTAGGVVSLFCPTKRVFPCSPKLSWTGGGCLQYYILEILNFVGFFLIIVGQTFKIMLILKTIAVSNILNILSV
jgi:hypothetical protein